MLAHGYTGFLLVEMVLGQESKQVREEELRRAYDLFKKYERVRELK